MNRHSQPLVSVIIPTLNAGMGLTRLLEALQTQQVPGDVEMIVIDSGSRDGTPELVRRAGAKVLTVPRHRFNHGRTRNQAVRASRGKFVAMTVQDALPADDHWLARLLVPLSEDPEVAGSYGLQGAPPGAGLLPRSRSALWCEANSTPTVKCLETPEEFWKKLPEERLALIRFDNVTSCIKRDVWEKIPFPERNYGEDMAWAKEVLLHCYKIAYVPTAGVWHCHERGWPYELRRAYTDGYARVQLVEWPSGSLTWEDALVLLRRMAFFLWTNKFDALVKPEAIRSFLGAELQHYEPMDSSRPVAIYLEILKFAWGLMDRALHLCSDGVLPKQAWINLLRFATVTMIGQNLGTTSAWELTRAISVRKVFWNTLHCLLGRGV